jgi:hypothetical protein
MANYDINLNVKANADFSAVTKELNKLSDQQRKAARGSGRSVPTVQSGGAERVIQQQGASGAGAAGRVAGAEIALRQQAARALGGPDVDIAALKKEATANLKKQLSGVGLDDKEVKNAVARFQRALNKSLQEATATIEGTRTGSAAARDIYNREAAASGVVLPQAETRKSRDVVRDYESSRQDRLQRQLDRSAQKRQQMATSGGGAGGGSNNPPNTPSPSADDFFYSDPEEKVPPYKAAAKQARQSRDAVDPSIPDSIGSGIASGDPENFIENSAIAKAYQTYIKAILDEAAVFILQSKGLAKGIAEANAAVKKYKQAVSNQEAELLNNDPEFISSLGRRDVLSAERRAATAGAIQDDSTEQGRLAAADLELQRRAAQRRAAVTDLAASLGVPPEQLTPAMRQSLFAKGLPALNQEEEIRYGRTSGTRVSNLGKLAEDAAFNLDPAEALTSINRIDAEAQSLELDLQSNLLLIDDESAKLTIQSNIARVKELRSQLALAGAELAKAGPGLNDSLTGIFKGDSKVFQDFNAGLRRENATIRSIGQLDPAEQAAALASSEKRLQALRDRADAFAGPGQRNLQTQEAIDEYQRLQVEIKKTEQAQRKLAAALANPGQVNAAARLSKLYSQVSRQETLLGKASRQKDPAARASQLDDIKKTIADINAQKVSIDTSVDPQAVIELRNLNIALDQLNNRVVDVEAGGVVGRGGVIGGGPGGGGGGGGVIPGAGGAGGAGGERGDIVSRIRQRGGALGFFGSGALSSIKYGLPSLLFYGALSGIGNALQEAEEFQFALSKIESQITETFGPGSGILVDDFKQGIIDLAQETGVAADQLATLSTQLIGAFAEADTKAQGGPRPSGIGGLEFVEQQQKAAAKIAQVTKLPLTEITDGLTAASLAFGKTFEEIGNVAVNLESKTGTLARETISFIGDIAPVAQEAGFSLEEFASIAAIAQQRSGRSGTALAESFGRIIPRIRESRLELAAIAASAPDAFSEDFFAAIENQDPRGILLGIGEAYDELDQKTRDQINFQLGGSREAQALIPALAQGQRVIELSQGAADAGGQLEARFQNVSKTLTVQLQKLSEEAREFVLILLESGLEDVFSTLISTTTALLEAFKKLFGFISDINDATNGWAAKLTGVAATVAIISQSLKLIGGLNFASGLTNLAASLSAGPGMAGRNPRAPGGGPGGLTAFLASLGSSVILGGVGGQREAAQQRRNIPQLQGYPASMLGRVDRSVMPPAFGGNVGPGWLGLSEGRGAFGRPTLGRAGSLGGTQLTGLGSILGLTAAYGVLSTLAPDLFSVEQAKEEAVAGLAAYDEAIANKIASARKIVTTSPDVLGLSAGSTGSDAEVAALEESLATAAGSDNIGQTLAAIITGEQSVYDRTFDALEEAKARRTSELLTIVGANNEVQNAFGAVGKRATELLNQDNLGDIVDVGTFGDPGGAGRRTINAGNDILDQILGEFVIDQGYSIQEILSYLEGDDPLLALKQARDGGDELANAILNFLTERDFFNSEAARLAREQLSQDDLWVGRINSQQEALKGLEDLRRRFQAGSISWVEYQTRVKEVNFNALGIAQRLAEEGEDNQAFLEEWANTASQNAEVYNSLIGSLEARVTDAQNLFASTPEDLARAQASLSRVLTTAVSDPQLNSADSENYARQLIKLAQDQQGLLISSADSLEEVAAILDQGIELPVEAKIAVIKNSFNIIGTQWIQINQSFLEFFDVSLDAYFKTVFAASDGSVESARQIIIDQIAAKNAYIQKRKATQALLVSLFGQSWNSPNSSIFKEIEKTEKENILLFYSLLGLDASGTLEAGNNIEQARASNSAITALRKSQTQSQLKRAEYDQLAAFFETQLSAQTPQGDDDQEAAARLNDVKEASRQLLKKFADAERSIARALADYIGDSALGAGLDFAQAEADLAFAQAGGDEIAIAEATANLIKAKKAVRDGFIQRMELMSDFAAAQTEDPLEDANIELDLAKRIEATALSEEERLKAQIRVLDANKKVEEAMRNIREAQFNLRKAELDAVEDSVGAAQLEVSRAREILNEALTKNLGTAAVDNARSGVIAAEKAARDAIFQDRMADYKFLLDMGQITQSQYADYLEGLKNTLIPGTRQFKDLEVTIKQLRDDIGGNLQSNLPTSLQLPTLYEVRRLNQVGQGAAPGQGIGYQDNRNVQVTVYVNNGMTEDQVVGTLSKALNVGTTGLESRRY